MDAFDSDALIYAAAPGHPLGRRVQVLFDAPASERLAGVGSVLLIPELLAKPLRNGDSKEASELARLIGRLDLRPVDRAIADFAAGLAAKYRLRALDATHLATAAAVGADRFITNNSKDFPKSITEVDVVYPTDLPDL
jgi:predicted nucleic acid-binding protein